MKKNQVSVFYGFWFRLNSWLFLTWFQFKTVWKDQKKNSEWQRRWGNVALFLVVTVVLFLKLKPILTQLG